MQRELIIAKDGEDWGVCDRKLVFENETPFRTREEARAFLLGIHTCQRRYATFYDADCLSWIDFPLETPAAPSWSKPPHKLPQPPVQFCSRHANIETQNAEFDACAQLADAWHMLKRVTVVDDDYPQYRQKYEIALLTFIAAIYRNGRRWPAE